MVKEIKSKEVEDRKIMDKILILRGQKVMIDSDLAELYGVETKRLNEQVKRNLKRFPQDFMFQLTREEKNEVVAICDHLKKLKFSTSLPYAFTEHGAVMLAGVLNSQRAINVNIQIVRIFVKLREVISFIKEIWPKIEELEKNIEGNQGKIRLIFEALKQLLE